MIDAMNTPSQQTYETQPEVRAGMSWGIKQSFNRYVDAMPDGQRAAGAGATAMPDGTFFFELADAVDFDPQTGMGTIRYQGDVRYKAHKGVLFVMNVDPWLEFAQDRAELTVIDAQHWPDRDKRLVLATLEKPQSTSTLPPGWMSLDAHLTPTGVDLFNNVYDHGEQIDPVRFSFMT